MSEKKYQNDIEKPGTVEMTVTPAKAFVTGWVVRREPGINSPEHYVVIPACEIMGRDIGRFIRFVEPFGGENESRKVIVGELRQIYMVGDGGDEVTLNVGTCDPQEYSFRSTDLIAVYGGKVTQAPLDSLDAMIYEANHG